MRYLVNIKYDGTLYYGFQKQPDVISVQEHIEKVLSKILNDKITITGSSRTDRGVHANDFYFHFDIQRNINTDKLTKSLNSLTNLDIYVKKTILVNDEFHARYNVVSKEYKYVINTGVYNPFTRNYILQYNTDIDIELLKEASNYLIGTHDFKSFTSDNEKDNTIRTINYINIEKESDIVTIYVSASGFLKYMVRNIVGLLLDINEGKKQKEDIPYIIECKDRTKLGLCAPSHALYLNKTEY